LNLMNLNFRVKTKNYNLGRRHASRALRASWFNAFVMGVYCLLASTPGVCAIVETDGMVVIEAEHFTGSTAASGHAWVGSTNAPGYVGASAMFASPNTGLNVSSNIQTNSPGLKYQVQFTHTGTYKFWVRGWAASGSDDSVHVGVDGLTPQTVSYAVSGAWIWKSGQVVIATVGVHELNLWMREDGAYVDRLLITTNAGYVPTGNGPAETTPPTATFRWASEAGRIYVEGGGTATLSDISAALPNAPLCLLDATNQVWFLGATLMVVDGSKLVVHGTGIGGDADELWLRSDNSLADGSCAAVDADWGTLDFKNVKIKSLNQLTATPDAEHATLGRAFIRARSRYVGTAVQQSALSVVNCEVAYLGTADPDAYGLTWQVVGSAPDNVKVLGLVSNSYLHHCELGLPTESWDDVPWKNSTVASNTLHGFNPTQGNNVFANVYRMVYRWAGSSQRIYMTGPGDATLTELKALVPQAPLTLVDATNKIWRLDADLFVENGARLKLYGPAIGGDVRELRLKSENTTASNAIVEVRADHGWLDIRNTKITSWNSAVNGPDTSTNYGRAYIRARSKLDPDGQTAHESRMDILNSEICYLGYKGTEAYGLTWKVVDTTAVYLPPGSTNTLFDLVNVYGDILNSRIHHNYFGVYSYGHYGGRWSTNEVDNNIAYGFDPHDDSDYLIIEKNHVHHNGWHGIIASKRCDHGVLRNNSSHNNGLDLVNPHGHGIMLHRSCNDWLIEGNNSSSNSNSGIAIFASDRTTIRNNVCSSNANSSIRLSVGSEKNWIGGNQLNNSGQHGLYLYEGNDPPEPDDDGTGLDSGRPASNTFTNNQLIGYGAEAIKVQNSDSNVFAGNVLLGNNTLLRFDTATNNLVTNNILPSDTLAKLVGSVTNIVTSPNVTNTVVESTFTTFAQQSRLTLQLDNYSTGTFHNRNGAIFLAIQTNLPTTVTATGSRLVLTAAQVGTGPGLVTTRNFTALPNSSSAQITVTTWNTTGGNRNKTWTVQGSSASMNINYSVGDLRAGSTYEVRRGGATIASLQANSQGYITFSSSPGSTAPVIYTVR
jgi:poly(beta-D-mannuronate) C5 epimerase